MTYLLADKQLFTRHVPVMFFARKRLTLKKLWIQMVIVFCSSCCCFFLIMLVKSSDRVTLLLILLVEGFDPFFDVVISSRLSSGLSLLDMGLKMHN